MKKLLHTMLCFVLIACSGRSVAQTFTSTPVTDASVGSQYSYAITATEGSNNPLTFTASTIPAWLTFTPSSQSSYTTFGGSVPNPIGISSDSDGNTYVSTYYSNNSIPIYKITKEGTTTNWATRQAGNVYAMASYNGFLYLSYYTSTGGSKVTRVDLSNPSAGESTVVSFASGTSTGIAFYQGFLYVARYSERKVVKVNISTGTYTEYVTNISSSPWGIIFDSAGNLFIATYGGSTVQKFDGSTLSTVISSVPGASDIEFDNSGYLYVASYSGGIRKYAPGLSTYTQVVPTASGPIYGTSLANTGALVFSLFNQATCGRVQLGATLIGTPGLFDIGVHNVSLNVSNGTTTNNQSFSITVTGPPTIAALPNIIKNYGDASLILTNPISNSSGTFSYSSNNTSVATVSGNTLNIIGKGTTTITAMQAAAGLYTTGTKTFTVTVNAIAPTLSGFPNISKTLGNPSFTLTAPTSNSSGTFSYTSSNPSVASINGNTIILNSSGTSIITATQAAQGNYLTGSITSTLTVNSNLQGPANINNGISMWLDASDVNADGSTPNSGTVFNTWKDKSGNAHDAVKYGTQNGVTYLTNQINGKPAVRFSRVNDHQGSVLEAAGVDIRAGSNPDVTMFTVYKQGARNETSGQGQALWGNDNGAWDRFFYNSWAHTDDGIASLGTVNPTFIGITGAGVPNSLRLMTAVFDGTVSGNANSGPAMGSAIYFDGKVVTKFTDNTDPFQAQTSLRIGNDGDNGSFNGDIAEMIVYNRKLTDCEIQTINEYLSTKYGVVFTTATISTSGPTAFCQGASVTLTANSGASYQWFLNGTPINGATSNTYIASTAGNYSVTITSESGCSATSAVTSVSIYPPVTASASNNGAVNTGNTINLSATGGGAYSWTGPNNFTSTQQNPIIPNATTSSAGTYTVTVTTNGCTATDTTNVIVNAIPAGALSFDGINDYVAINNPFTAFGKELTVEWNANIDPSSPIGSGIGQSLPNSDGSGSLVWLMHYSPDVQKIQFYISDNGVWKHADAIVPAGWHKFTGVASGTSIKIYMDGNLISTSADVVNTGILNVPNSVIHFGKDSRYAGGRFMKGGIDEVRIWSRALCIGEIQNNLTGELTGSQDGLQEYYKFNQGFVRGNNAGVTTLADLSGNNRTGNLFNFALNGSSSNWIEGAVSGSAPAFIPPTASISANGPLSFCPTGSVTFTANSGDGFTYQWTKDGSPIEGATAASYSAGTSGSYNVIITKSGCTASAEAQQVVVEDLIAPTTSTLQDVVIDLDNNCSFIVPDYRPQLSMSDNCTPKSSLVVTQSPAPGTISTGEGSISVSFNIKDLSGNAATSLFTLVKRDVTAPVVTAKNFSLYLGSNGTGTLTTSNVNNNSADGCSPVALSFSNAGKICAIANEGGTLSITAPEGAIITSIDFASYGNATGSCGSFVQGWCHSTLSQSRVEAAFLGKNTGSIGANNNIFGDPCYGTVKRLVVQATYSIPGVSTNGESVTFSCNQVGDNTVTLIGSDASGNVSNATATVTVIDSVKPIALAKNLTIQLDASGRASTTAEAVNNGSSDACGIKSIALSKTAFDCSNIGDNMIVLTVTDVNGNVATANATLTVKDNITPVVLTQNITVQLNANGQAFVNEAQINKGSFDNCSIASYALNKTSFDCSNVGVNTVILTVTDVNGNVASAPATVTVQDNVAPAVRTQNATIQLNANGQGSITESQINNGSSDNCSIASYALSKTSFDCSNVGINTVILTVTDVNGNVASAPATVTVEDNIAPVALVKNISVTLVNGAATITAASMNNGSNDACGIKSLAVDKTAFDCSNLGNNTVILTVIDNHGNVSSATATVNVIGVKPVPSIAVSRTDNTFTGLNSKTIALGYGAQNLTLAASNATSANNATTYIWYPSTGLSNANVANPVFTPTTAGSYTFNVVATNEFGCTASTSVTVTVLDVRCGSKNEKVLICQKTGSSTNPWVQICISANAVDTHLKKGSTLGTCGATTSSTLAALPASETLSLSNTLSASSTNRLTVYPNPFVNETTVSFTLIANQDKVSLDLYDLKGVRISNVYSGNAEAFKTYNFTFDGKTVPAGVYFFRLTGAGSALNFKVIVTQ